MNDLPDMKNHCLNIDTINLKHINITNNDGTSCCLEWDNSQLEGEDINIWYKWQTWTDLYNKKEPTEVLLTINPHPPPL